MPLESPEADDEASAGTHQRIVAAAARLLESGGRSAVSIRAVGAAAGVQAPTIYRAFGDKQGLLHAVATDGLARYLAGRTVAPSSDPLTDLRSGWDAHVELGLRNPALYLLLYDEHAPGTAAPAALAAHDVLAGLVRRVAEAGRLRVPERRAAQLLQAVGRGTTLTLIALPEADRDPELSRTAREAVLAAIAQEDAGTVEPRPVADELVRVAVTLRALLPQTQELTDPERALLAEWLGRIADPAR